MIRGAVSNKMKGSDRAVQIKKFFAFDGKVSEDEAGAN